MRHIETPTPETFAKNLYEIEQPEEGSPRLRRRHHHLIDQLLDKGLLTPQQHAAGLRFYRDFSIGAVGQLSTSSWKERTGSRAGDGDITIRQLQARRSFRTAWDALAPVLRDVAWRIACFEEGMEQVEKALNLPRRSAKTLLSAALDQLNLHYHSPRKLH
jgi:hypothetical protein